MTVIGHGGRLELQVPLLAVTSAGADPDPGQLGNARIVLTADTYLLPAGLARAVLAAPAAQVTRTPTPRKIAAVTFTDNCAARPMMDPGTTIRPGSEDQARRVRPPKV
jgi:hypothetical protein